MSQETAEPPPTQRRLWRSVGALFAGVLTNVVLSFVTDLAMLATGVFAPFGEPMAESVFLIPTAYRTVYGILGSYITARLAPYRPMTHVIALGILGTAVSSLGIVAALNSGPELGPLWYPIAICATALPCSWIGGKLAERRIS